MAKATKEITIKSAGKVAEDAWDFPLEEVGYLLKEHDGETFVLKDGRLWEAKPTKKRVARCPYCGGAMWKGYSVNAGEDIFECGNCGISVSIVKTYDD